MKVGAAFCLMALAACEAPGERTRELAGGYQLIKHDGLRQIVSPGGEIVLDDVASATSNGSLVTGTMENGVKFELATASGELRMISGEKL